MLQILIGRKFELVKTEDDKCDAALALRDGRKKWKETGGKLAWKLFVCCTTVQKYW